MNSHNDQLPDGLIDQLVEHCTSIAEVSQGLNCLGFPFVTDQGRNIVG